MIANTLTVSTRSMTTATAAELQNETKDPTIGKQVYQVEFFLLYFFYFSVSFSSEFVYLQQCIPFYFLFLLCAKYVLARVNA